MGFLGRVLFSRNSSKSLAGRLVNNPIYHSRHFNKNKISGRNISIFRNENSRRIVPNLSLPTKKHYSCSSQTNQKKLGRHQYHEDIEKAVNNQIQTEFTASYAYLSMSAFFGRTEIALPGCQGFFYNMYVEETEHAAVFMNYQLMRGGQVVLLGIEAPQKDWGSIDKAFEAGLHLEETVKEKICSLVEVAEKYHDHQLVDFLTSQYLKEQNECIQEMGRFTTRAKKMVKDPNGEFLFDRQLFLNYVKDKNLMFLTQLPDKDDKTYK